MAFPPGAQIRPELILATYEAFAAQFIAPRIITARAPLSAAIYQTPRRQALSEALNASFRPINLGHRWGPKWSTCWFKLKADARQTRALSTTNLALRFSTDTEALLYINRTPHQGLDVNRDTALLPIATARALLAGKETLLVEAACNHPFGAVGLPWESDDTKRRWESETPGHFLACELINTDAQIQALHRDYTFAIALARELLPEVPPMFAPSAPWAPGAKPWQDARAEQLLEALRRATELLKDRATNLSSIALSASRLLRAAFNVRPGGSTPLCHAVGHAHIDTAWLWPLDETRRKCQRTFSNVLRLMERDSRFVFLCTQAQQYAYIERDAPALFKQIAARVREGRWEPGGGAWVEPDCNVPSGESLARQLLHGCRYFTSRFGEKAGAQRHLFLPDTFGFPAQLPQLMQLASLDTFITNKLSWNDTNPFPHTTFRWLAPDGTSVLAHQTPGYDYNATLSPRELRRGITNHRTKQLASTNNPTTTGPRYLQPFGFGDGGGGPTEAMLHAAHTSAHCEGLPVVQLSRTDDFAQALHNDEAAAKRTGLSLPEHRGELALELHRGTLTTQSWIKQANRQAEDDLRLTELLLAGSPRPLKSAERTRALKDLDEAWKLLLLNQFHDILPGSSIAQVYDDARAQFDRINVLISPWLDRGIALWTSALNTKGIKRPIVCFNPASTARGSVFSEGAAAFVAGADALSCELIDAAGAAPAEVIPVKLDADTKRRTAILDNGLLRAVIDPLGQITSLRAVGSDLSPNHTRELCASTGVMNALTLYEDHPRQWEAWDIDAATLRHPIPQLTPATTWEVLDAGPARVAIRVVRPVGQSSEIEQTISFSTESRSLEIRSRVRWNEDRRLLRAEFATSVESSHAHYQTQFARVARPALGSTARDSATFESATHRWVAALDTLGGVGVLNDHKYAACATHQPGSHRLTLEMTLLRAANYPAVSADRGEHEFTYALCIPHPLAPFAGLDSEAESLHRSLFLREAKPNQQGLTGGSWSPLTVDFDEPASVTVSALKFAEDNDGSLIIRIAETAGSPSEISIDWNLPITSVEPVNILERPLKGPQRPQAFKHASRQGRTTLRIAPFQIVTLRAR